MRGMTLVEVLIVMAIMALLIGGVATGLGAGRQAEVSRATNQLANTIRFGFNKARVTGSYYRLLINLDEGSFTMQRGDGRMYLPAKDRYGRIVDVDPSREKEREERDRRAAENFNRSIQAKVLAAVKAPVGRAAQAPTKAASATPGKAGAAAPGKAGAAAPAKAGAAAPANASKPGSTSSFDQYAVEAKAVPRRKPPIFGAFEDDNSLSDLKKPFKLPPQVKVVSVQTADDTKPITEGEASLFFFPQGHTQLAHIQIEEVDKPENAFTIIVQPLTGRVSIENGKVNLVLERDPSSAKDDLQRSQSRRSL